MSDWLASGRLVDVVIAITVIEALALAIYHRISGKGVAPSQFLVNLVSGLCLMLALRAALAGAGPLWVACWVTAAGLAHVLDLRQRWKS